MIGLKIFSPSWLVTLNRGMRWAFQKGERSYWENQTGRVSQQEQNEVQQMRKGLPGGPGGQKTADESAVNHCWFKSETCPGLHLQGHCQQIETGSSHSSQHLSGHTWSAVSTFCPHNSKQTRTGWSWSKGEPRRWSKSWRTCLCVKT